jgi:hypothetical protein
MIYDQWLGGMDATRVYKLGATDLNVAGAWKGAAKAIASSRASRLVQPRQRRLLLAHQRRAGLHRLPARQCAEGRSH